MALLSTILPNYSADVVAIYDDNFSQLFTGATPMKAVVKESKKVMEHPVETGVVITDHTIINPVEIELSMLLVDFRQLYAQIKNVFLKSQLLSIQTRTGTYDNMMFTDIPHEEDPALFDVIAIALKLKEVQFVQAQFDTLPASKVANKSNASTIERGEQQSAAANATQTTKGQSVAFGWAFGDRGAK